MEVAKRVLGRVGGPTTLPLNSAQQPQRAQMHLSYHGSAKPRCGNMVVSLEAGSYRITTNSSSQQGLFGSPLPTVRAFLPQVHHASLAAWHSHPGGLCSCKTG